MRNYVWTYYVKGGVISTPQLEPPFCQVGHFLVLLKISRLINKDMQNPPQLEPSILHLEISQS